jgi:hypothetical protein
MTPTRDERGARDALPPFFEQLEHELVRAGERQLRRRNRRRTLVAAAVAVIVAAGALAVSAGLRSDSAEATDIQVATDGERVTVTFDRDEIDGATVVEQLRAAGLTVDEVRTPTGSSRVGRVVAIGGGPDLTVADSNGTVTYEGLWGARIQVHVGEATSGGFDAFTDALAAGEPLACGAWKGQAASDLSAVADANGITVTFRDEERQRMVSADELTGYVVTGAIAVAPDEVRVDVVEGDARPDPDPGC